MSTKKPLFFSCAIALLAAGMMVYYSRQPSRARGSGVEEFVKDLSPRLTVKDVQDLFERYHIVPESEDRVEVQAVNGRVASCEYYIAATETKHSVNFTPSWYDKVYIWCDSWIR